MTTFFQLYDIIQCMTLYANTLLYNFPETDMYIGTVGAAQKVFPDLFF